MPGPARAIVLLCEFSSSMVAQMRSQVVPAVSDAVRLARNSSSCSLHTIVRLRTGVRVWAQYALVLADVAFLLGGVLLVELVDGALGLADGLLPLGF